MDEVARRYLLLGLRLARHRPDLLGASHGPPELAEAVAGEEPALAAELHTEAMTLAGMAAELAQETPESRRRSAWLVSQLKAMSALSRRIGGEEIVFVDLAEELLEASVSLELESTFQAAHRMLDSALPGAGPLRERPARHARAVVKDTLLMAAGHAELTLPVRLSPQAVIAEGMTSLAREVVMTDGELGYELGLLARREGMEG